MNMNRAIPLLGLALLTSCTAQRKIDRDELKSDLASGVSFRLRRHVSICSIQRKGARYGPFQKVIFSIWPGKPIPQRKSSSRMLLAPEDSQALDAARVQFEALSRQLALMASRTSDANARIHSMRQLTEIGRAMEEAKRAL